MAATVKRRPTRRTRHSDHCHASGLAHRTGACECTRPHVQAHCEGPQPGLQARPLRAEGGTALAGRRRRRQSSPFTAPRLRPCAASALAASAPTRRAPAHEYGGGQRTLAAPPRQWALTAAAILVLLQCVSPPSCAAAPTTIPFETLPLHPARHLAAEAVAAAAPLTPAQATHNALARRAVKGATLRLTTLFYKHSGLCNQHISLVNLLSIAITAGVDVVAIPPALHRRKFVDNRFDDPTRLASPVATAETLWDVASIRTFLAAHGVALDLRRRNAVHPQEALLPRDHYFLGQKELAQAALNLHDDTRAHFQSLPPPRLLELAALGGNVTLHIPNLFLGLRTVDSSVATAVMRAAPFAPFLRGIAADVVRTMLQRTGAASFNGVHLRVEQDVVYKGDMDSDGKPVSERLSEYSAAFKALEFEPWLPVYVASGIFVDTEARSAGLYKSADAWLETEVVGKVAASLAHKGMFMAEDVAASLLIEQLAVVDFLVLQQAAKLVGYGGSSFSYGVQEARALDGKDRGTSKLIRCCHPGFDVGLAFHAT